MAQKQPLTLTAAFILVFTTLILARALHSFWTPATDARECVRPVPGAAGEKGGPVRLAINYADRCCETSQPKSCASMVRHGAHRCISYNASALDSAFQERNKNILVQDRGAGFWLWKPYIILKTLLYELEEGDLLLYADSGSFATRDLGPLFDLAKEDDIVIFQTPKLWYLRERQWTKPDAFTIMGCPVKECGKEVQMLAAFSLWRRTFRSIQFVSQWLSYMEDYRLSTDAPSELHSNISGFAEHRHDQSVLGLLAHKWQITPYNISYVHSVFKHTRDRT